MKTKERVEALGRRMDDAERQIRNLDNTVWPQIRELRDAVESTPDPGPTLKEPGLPRLRARAKGAKVHGDFVYYPVAELLVDIATLERELGPSDEWPERDWYG